MNYKNLAYRGIQNLLNNNSNYSLGEVLYCILRLKSFDIKVKDIKDISDEELYELVETAIKVESDE